MQYFITVLQMVVADIENLNEISVLDGRTVVVFGNENEQWKVKTTGLTKWWRTGERESWIPSKWAHRSLNLTVNVQWPCQTM